MKKVQELINTLEKQNKIYKALIEVSYEMKDLIEKNDVKELDILVKVESALAMKFQLLENKRKSISKLIKEEFSISEESFNMTKLKEYLNEKEGKQIQQIQKNLINSMKILDEINSSNNMLVKSRLDWIELSLRILGKNKGENYTKNQKIKSNVTIVDEVI